MKPRATFGVKSAIIVGLVISSQNVRADTTEKPSLTASVEPDASANNDQQASQDETLAGREFTRPFAGTAVYFNHQFTAISLNKGHDYTYNPVYQVGFGLSPVLRIHPSFFLLTELGFTTELTNSDYAARQGEVFFRDIPIQGWYQHTVQVNNAVGFQSGLLVGVLIPTSKVSRFATLYTVLSVGTQVGFRFPNVLKGLSLVWLPRFSKYFQESQNPAPDKNKLLESGIPPVEQLTSETFQSLYFTDGINPSWSMANTAELQLLVTDNLIFSFSYIHKYIYKYTPKMLDLGTPETPLGPTEPHDTGFDEQGIYSQTFVYDLTYRLPKPVRMLRASVGALTASNQVGPDGSYRTPFFNRETIITFGLSWDIDGTVSALRGERDYKYDNEIEQFR